jgi:Phage integrase family
MPHNRDEALVAKLFHEAARVGVALLEELCRVGVPLAKRVRDRREGDLAADGEAFRVVGIEHLLGLRLCEALGVAGNGNEKTRDDENSSRHESFICATYSQMMRPNEFMKMGKSVKMARSRSKTHEMDAVTLAARRQTVYLSKAEVERFFNAIPRENARDSLLFEMIYRYGLRRREAGLIRLDHLSERIWISRLKGGVPGEYPIHPRTRRLLWAYLGERGRDDRPYLFVTRQSATRPISPSTIYALFRRYAEAAAIPRERQHPHALRHSIATHLLDAGWDIADVQDWLGHADIASTQVYAMVTNKRRETRYEESLLSDAIAANNAS